MKTSAMPVAEARKRMGLEPAQRTKRSATRRLAWEPEYRNEDEVQEAIVSHLRQLGYIVLQTSEHRRRQRCSECGNWATLGGGRGCDHGVPDLLVRWPGGNGTPGWVAGNWQGLEVKGPRTPVSPVQQHLADGGHIHIVRSVAEALTALGR